MATHLQEVITQHVCVLCSSLALLVPAIKIQWSVLVLVTTTCNIAACKQAPYKATAPPYQAHIQHLAEHTAAASITAGCLH